MRKSNNKNTYGEILTIEQASQRVNLGLSTVRKLADKCGASLKIGRSYRINIQKLIDYLCQFENKNATKNDVDEKGIEKIDESFEAPKVVVNFRIDERVIENIDLLASCINISRSKYIARILTEYVNDFVKTQEEKDDAN